MSSTMTPRKPECWVNQHPGCHQKGAGASLKLRYLSLRLKGIHTNKAKM